MKTSFVEYVERKEKINDILASVVIEAENNPELLEVLQEAGFLNNLWNAGKEIWKGVKNTGTAAMSQFTGPASQYANALSALQKAYDQIKKDPNWSQSQTTGSSSIKSMPLLKWLEETIQELKNQSTQFSNKQMPGTLPTQAAQAAPGATFDPAGTKF